MGDLGQLFKADADIKPDRMDEEVSALVQYYEDNGRTMTLTMLGQMGVGLKDKQYPLEISMLRYIIDRIATVYDRPPTRWLRSPGGNRLEEDSDEHGRMVDALNAMQWDLVMRELDRLRALTRQVVLRYYPSDAEQNVIARLFLPNTVFRRPDPAAGDRIEHDAEFALKLSGDVYEHWERTADGWRMQWLTAKGEPLPEDRQPFASTGLLSPYSELPVSMVYDSYPGGRPWLAPRCSRRGWVESLNHISNDLLALITNQAHSQRLYKKRDPNNKFPTDTGPGTAIEIDADEDVEDLTPNPKIDECQNVLDYLTRLWLISETLPIGELDTTRQQMTGAALKTAERPLLARRESQIPLAYRDERLAWSKIRAVHNYHHEAWLQQPFDESTSLDVELADLDAPVDAKDLYDAGARGIALGTHSVIDLIMREDNCSRVQAIAKYERVRQDNETYPPAVVIGAPSEKTETEEPTPQAQSGPRPLPAA